MRHELNMCLAVVLLLAMVLCSCRAAPAKNREEADAALQKIVRRLMAKSEQPQAIRREGYNRNRQDDVNVFERDVRVGRNPPGMALIPLEILRKQYEAERRRRIQQEQDERNQKFFESIG